MDIETSRGLGRAEADFEQYKFYWEALDRLSQRRSTSSTFAIAVNSAILGMVGLVEATFAENGTFLIALSGLIVSFVWLFQIFSNRQLLKAKFKVIHELEEHLGLKLFRREWEIISDHRGKQIWPNAFFEQLFPVIFIMIFGALLMASGLQP
ncbi:MAG: hypothetical protein AAF376_10005 [Pseudomonadota bacterium]